MAVWWRARAKIHACKAYTRGHKGKTHGSRWTRRYIRGTFSHGGERTAAWKQKRAQCHHHAKGQFGGQFGVNSGQFGSIRNKFEIASRGSLHKNNSKNKAWEKVVHECRVNSPQQPRPFIILKGEGRGSGAGAAPMRRHESYLCRKKFLEFYCFPFVFCYVFQIQGGLSPLSVTDRGESLLRFENDLPISG